MPAQYLKPCVNRIIRIVSVPSSSRQNRLQRIWVGQHDTEFQTTLVSPFRSRHQFRSLSCKSQVFKGEVCWSDERATNAALPDPVLAELARAGLFLKPDTGIQFNT